MISRKSRLRPYRSGTRYVLLVMCALVALAGCGDSDDPSAEDLLGTWKASFGPTWWITEERISVTGGAVSEIRYVATDTTIEVSDDSGCPSGTYEWEIDEDVLTLTVVTDDFCEVRQDNWNGATFGRVN